MEHCVTDVYPFENVGTTFYAQSAKLDEKVNVNLHHLHTVEAYSFCAVEVHAF